MVVGNPAYPLLDWLIKGYTNSPNLTPEQESFNVYLGSLRVGVEMAFGKLKSRWRLLLNRSHFHFFAPTMIAICCALHNFCEKRNGVNLNRLNDIHETDQLYPQPTQPVHASVGTNDKNAREALTKYLAHHFPPRQGHLHWKQTLPKRGHYYVFAIFYLKKKIEKNTLSGHEYLSKQITKPP